MKGERRKTIREASRVTWLRGLPKVHNEIIPLRLVSFLPLSLYGVNIGKSLGTSEKWQKLCESRRVYGRIFLENVHFPIHMLYCLQWKPKSNCHLFSSWKLSMSVRGKTAYKLFEVHTWTQHPSAILMFQIRWLFSIGKFLYQWRTLIFLRTLCGGVRGMIYSNNFCQQVIGLYGKQTYGERIHSTGDHGQCTVSDFRNCFQSYGKLVISMRWWMLFLAFKWKILSLQPK